MLKEIQSRSEAWIEKHKASLDALRRELKTIKHTVGGDPVKSLDIDVIFNESKPSVTITGIFCYRNKWVDGYTGPEFSEFKNTWDEKGFFNRTHGVSSRDLHIKTKI